MHVSVGEASFDVLFHRVQLAYILLVTAHRRRTTMLVSVGEAYFDFLFHQVHLAYIQLVKARRKENNHTGYKKLNKYSST